MSHLSMALRGERIEFPSRRGNLLVGDLHRPQEGGGPVLVLCHGMESTRGGTKQQAIVERFAPLGFTILRFDFSYVGDSEGEFENLTVSGEVDDTLGALDFLEDFEPSTCVLVGSSLGGAVALLAAAQVPDRVDAVATIAAVADTALFTERLTQRDVADWRSSGRRAWGANVLKVDFLDDVERLDLPAAIARLQQPILVMHGESDDVVPLSHARIIEQAAAGPVRVATFAGVGHRFEEAGALAALLDTLESWLAEVVPSGKADA
jgi:putative redox protein